jgi:hypothetical protein
MGFGVYDKISTGFGLGQGGRSVETLAEAVVGAVREAMARALEQGERVRGPCSRRVKGCKGDHGEPGLEFKVRLDN